jgi:hypothetical protein
LTINHDVFMSLTDGGDDVVVDTDLHGVVNISLYLAWTSP